MREENIIIESVELKLLNYKKIACNYVSTIRGLQLTLSKEGKR